MDQMMIVETRDGRTLRGYVEEADAANGVWISDEDGPTLVRWEELANMRPE